MQTFFWLMLYFFLVDRAIDIRISLSNYKSQSENSRIWRYGILAEVNGLSMSLIFNTLLNFFSFSLFKFEMNGVGWVDWVSQNRSIFFKYYLINDSGIFINERKCRFWLFWVFFVAQRFYLKNKKIQCSFKIKAFLDRIMKRNSMKYRFVPQAIVVN